MALNSSTIPHGRFAVSLTPDAYPNVKFALTDPARWNSEWEALYISSPTLVHPSHILGMASMKRERLGAEGTSNNGVDRYACGVNYEMTCLLQGRLGLKIVDAFVKDGFEERWAKVSIEERRDHALKSLANGGAQAGHLNLARAYCSDILKLDHLSSDAEVLLSLLREVMTQDLSILADEPYWFPCQEWDAVKEEIKGNPETTEAERFDLMEATVLRTELIYLVLEGIVDSFYGGTLPQRSRRGILCTNFGCMRSERDDEKFMRCAKCWKSIQRSVPYCSKPCQVADWKNRHKQICGTPLSSMDAVAAATRRYKSGQLLPFPSAKQFPAPINGFKRTPHLVSHMHLLETYPHVDFMLKINQRDSVRAIVPHEQIQALFRAARYKAFVEGDKEAYMEICHFLLWFVRVRREDVRQGWNINCALDTMEKEFAFPDLREKMKQYQERQRQDSLARPPLVISLSQAVWVEFLSASGISYANPALSQVTRGNTVCMPTLGLFFRSGPTAQNVSVFPEDDA